MREVTSVPGEPEASFEYDVETNMLGMWVFLATEVLFFGAVFTTYFIYRITYQPAFIEGSSHLNVLLGGINTAVLLTSSFMMALAVMSAQLKNRRGIILFLAFTIILGLIFIGIKALEWTLEYNDHLFPGYGWQYSSPNAPQVKLFFSLYFVLTGLHAAHMIVGVSLLTVMLIKAIRHQFDTGYFIPVEMVGLFWHFIDIVWIFIFPLLYLMHQL